MHGHGGDDCCGPRPPHGPPPWILDMIGARGRPERGEVRWLILQALQDGPKHGYAIIQAIEQRTKGAYKPSAGSVYPTLQLLEELDQVSATAEGNRKLYALTETGRKELADHAPDLEDCCERLDDGVGWTETFDFHALGHRVRRVLHGVHAGVRRGRIGGAELKRIREALDRALGEVEGILSGKKD
jgi:DNA-binding PadR family transcriptional regulator